MNGQVISHYYYFDEVLKKTMKERNRRQGAAYAFMKGSDIKRRHSILGQPEKWPKWPDRRAYQTWKKLPAIL